MEQRPSIEIQEIENEGSRLRLAGRLNEAAAVYQSALQQFPGNVLLLNGLGLVLLDAGSGTEACEVFSTAIQHAPQTGVLHFNFGNALRMTGDIGGALVHYEQARVLGLERTEVYNNVGISLQSSDRWEEARSAFVEALRRDPQYLPALVNLGHTLIELGRPEEAVPVLRAAVGLQPAYADAHWLLSHALLVTGQWPEGWHEYEWRWHRMKSAPYHRGTSESRWKGEDIAGKRILLYAEQGMGDAVQFVRYVPLVQATGAMVAIECHAELVPLFSTLDGVSEVYARGELNSPFDVACPLLSLPSMFGTTVDTLPSHVPYLRPDPARASVWRKRLELLAGRKRVGLVWAGNPAHTNDRKRSIPPDELAVLAGVPGMQFISLQKGASDETKEAVGRVLPILDWADGLQDFADTAALISELDLVITIDTAVAHVAGALNRPVWMMVPYTPDWRWFLGRTDSPWYPSLRIFRQPVRGAWQEVVKALCVDLRKDSLSPR
jgi:hypothetical protein